MASERAKKAAAARLKALEGPSPSAKRNVLRAKVAKGSRKTRRAAATELSKMPKQFK
jgi:hypothetical protein